jgi:uncharacterized membrane protein YkvA (DUF1232 family)
MSDETKRERGEPPVSCSPSGPEEAEHRGKIEKIYERLKRWAGRLKAEVHTLYLAYRDPRVPLYARVFAACVVGYAFSPIDLIPDPIPVLGYLDDLVLIPLGVALAIRMIPDPVLSECREKARQAANEKRPTNRVAAVVIVVIWLLLAALAILFVRRVL